MKRRDFIQLSAFAAAAISLPLLHSCNASTTELLAQPVFLSRLFDEHTIKDAGNAYLKNVPAENNKHKLEQLLADNNSIINSKDEKEIHKYLDKKIQQEFEAGNTVMVKGWILAVTEARQCALFSIIKN
ncbi:MAG TPA: hypothetical protein VHB70_08465 [Parafilimonas sp.]|nr:hypothetical protein [Parafilimonas sp.]